MPEEQDLPSADALHDSSLDPPLAIVGIGASAGGLAALSKLFDHVPPDSGLAFVIIVHLSPEHESFLADLLQKHVQMPIQQVTETVALEKDHVYVIPPGCNLNTIDTHLRLSDLEERRRERAPIDHFFRTLAKTHDGDAIGVVLTGTGSDGTLGLREIHHTGGLTIVQDPNEAEYDGMPQSAISTGVIDHVLPLAKIPGAILAFARTEPRVHALNASDPDEDEDEHEQHLLFKIFAQIRAGTGRDFTRYKPATILRRIARRMQLARIEELEEYLDLLRSEPDEVRAMADDLLITVTSFFRDPDAFAHIETEIIPEIFDRTNGNDAVRAWTVGCATGEEAYSMAMLLVEEAERRQEPPRIQVFASDLHERALKSARDGFYPGDIEADVSPERLARWFTKEDGGYRVKRELREMVVFAPHNILGDPPFSRLDLVSCRNLMIYLNREVQRDVIGLFHYALRPSSFLMLGTSETVDGSELFHTINKKHSLYRKRDVKTPEPRLRGMPALRMQLEGAIPRAEGSFEPATYGALHHKMVEAFAPPSILVGPDDQIVHVSEHAGRYLAIPGGAVTAGVLKLVREELRIDLRSALHQARESGRPVRTRPLNVRFNGEARSVVADVRPAFEPQREGFLLVIFDERDPQPERAVDEAAADQTADQAAVSDLEAELELTRHRLQTIIEEYETTQEEMRASNEELQSANEELRSTMEELETSKEELQSINEELQTVNQENRHKVEELALLSSDLQNFLGATEIATLFLDRSLRILRSTPQIAELFSVRTIDRGRPLGDLTHRLGYENLLEDAQRVIERLVPIEREIQDVEDRWFLSRMLPYRSVDDRIEGVVITFIDISERKRNEEEVREAKVFAEKIIETLHEPLLVLTPDLRVRTANPAFFDYFGVEPERTIGEKIYDLGNGQWDIPGLRTLLEDVLPDSQVFNDYEVRHTFEDIGERIMLLNARRLDHVQFILLGIRDITEKKRSEAALRESEEKYRTLFNEMDEAYAVVEVIADEQGRWTDFLFHDANPAFEHHTGLKCPVGHTATELLGTPNPRWIELYGQVVETGEPIRIEENEPVLGKMFDLSIFRVGVPGSNRVAVLFADITDRKRAEEALRESEERFRSMSNLVPDLLWRSDASGHTTWYNDRWMDYTGQTSEEALGWGWVDAVHPDDRTRSAEKYRRATEERRPMEHEHRIRRHDGEYCWFLVRAEPLLDEAGEVEHFFGTATDVHEQHTAREQLEARVEERTREVQQLARTLSMAELEERRRIARILHDDLQQVLFGIHLRLEYLGNDLTEIGHEQLNNDFEDARRWVSDAIDTTRQLAVDLNPPILDNEGIAEALTWLASQMQQKHGLTVRLNLDEEVRIADDDLRSLVFQAIRELLFNVVKHAGVLEAEVSIKTDNGDFIIAVADRGNGFTKESINASDMTQTGYGLPSVRERLRLIGGQMTITSETDLGTRVELVAPIKSA